MNQSRVNRRLSLPTGTETLLLQEAARHRQVTFALETLFQRWGYLPAETPIVDYFEVYRRLLSEADTRNTYRTLDRAGELLMIRADTTLFLAKQLGVHLRTEELPVRVYYNEQILRYEVEHDISRNEYQQAGVELVGVAGHDGDTEILLLLLESLAAADAKETVIHIGSRALLDTLVELGVPPDKYAELREAIVFRRREEFREILDATNLAPNTPAIEEIVFTIRPASDLQDVHLPEMVPDALERVVHNVILTIRTVAALRPEDRLFLDMSELGSHDYYTGIAFGAYAEGADSAIARGGRYDRLLRSFGCESPSVGFSIFTRKIPSVGAQDSGIKPASADGTTIEERYQNAKVRRGAGEAVQL